jgi:hypothetical protein
MSLKHSRAAPAVRIDLGNGVQLYKQFSLE